MRPFACSKAALLQLLSAVSFFSLAAQEKKISGIIKDEALTLLPAATVSGNSLVSSVSDTAGVFSITVPAGAEISFVTYVGHQPNELSIGNNDSPQIVTNIAAIKFF